MKRYYSVLVIKKRSLNSMTANFDTGVGFTKTVLKKFHYYSLSICPPIFYFLSFVSSFGIINWAERSISPVNKPIKDVEPGFIYDRISTSTLPHSAYLKYF